MFLLLPQVYDIFVALSTMVSIISVPTRLSTLQECIDVASTGDTVRVAPGYYLGDGNRDLDFRGKSIVLISEEGPEATFIACDGDEASPHRGFHFHSAEDSTAVVDGFTIIGGYAPRDGYSDRRVGGAIYCDSASSPTIRNCIMYNNAAWDGGSVNCYHSNATFINCSMSENVPPFSVGGGVYCEGGAPVFIGCEIVNNYALGGGGIFVRENSSPQFIDCVIDGNEATTGGGMHFEDAIIVIQNCIIRNNLANHGAAIYGGMPIIDGTIIHDNTAIESGACLRNCNSLLGNCTLARNTAPEGLIYSSPSRFFNCIIAFNGEGPVLVQPQNVSFSCTNMYFNADGDWTGDASVFADSNSNFSADPLFCDTASGDYGLWWVSPCLPESTGCGLVGAGDRGCVDCQLPVAAAIGFDSITPDYAVRSLTPTIMWIYTDTLETSQEAWEIEVGTDQNWSVAELWATGHTYGGGTIFYNESLVKL